MAETQFPEGIRFFKPFEEAPDFVKGNISITKSEFMEWLQNQPTDKNGRIKLDLKKSKGGNLYLDVNTYGVEQLSEEDKQAIQQQRKAAQERAEGPDTRVAPEDQNGKDPYFGDLDW